MKNHLVRRSVAALALGSLAAVGLASVPSPARAAVEEGQVGGQYGVSSWNCDGTDVGSSELDGVPWSDNNVPVSKNTSASSNFTAGEGDTDTVDASTSTSASITASPLGSGPATITGSASASASARASNPETVCDVDAHAQSAAAGLFTLTQPMWVTLTATGHGQRQGRAAGGSYVGIGTAEGMGGWLGGYLGLGFGGDGLMVSAGNRGSAVSSTLLPPGQYGVVFLATAVAEVDQPSDEGPDEFDLITAYDGSASYTGNFKVELKPAGTASAVTGKGAPLVQFGERDCTNGNVTVALSKKTVKKAKRVKFKVDGAKAAVLKGKGLKGKKPKARTVVLPTSASGVTKVKVKLVLANGRRMQATRSYLPCK
ncbi:hypothetical protein RB608_19035 [Nocardioides sp. LHD-245]|uniref:hypothetical protein n=1 Tax=Nocardioides sp. LHD-245 TaxID=3051387 RepID=UPI0027E15F55|nr:hypothetical protein [Nocardioides sp. LHD-245]